MASKKMVDVCTLGGKCDGICRQEHRREFGGICNECYQVDAESLHRKKRRKKRDEEDNDEEDRY